MLVALPPQAPRSTQGARKGCEEYSGNPQAQRNLGVALSAHATLSACSGTDPAV